MKSFGFLTNSLTKARGNIPFCLALHRPTKVWLLRVPTGLEHTLAQSEDQSKLGGEL